MLDLLAALDGEAWQMPTPCPGWSVQDVAAHVLGDDVGRLARTRDHFAGVAPSDREPFPQFIDRINAEWIVASRRMSPRLLISALSWTGEQIAELWDELPPSAIGEPVTWAGPDPAPTWLDAARDFTEYWVHRQQVHEALGQSQAQDPATLHTVIDTLMRALPHTLRTERRPVGTTFSFSVPGPAGGSWTVEREGEGWHLIDRAPSPNLVVLDAEDTWRLCVRMITPEAAQRRADVRGDQDLANVALTMVAIIRSD